MTPEEQACYDNLRADYDALAARLADWHRMADERSAEIVRLSTRLAEADALLLMTKWSVLCVAEDAYRAHRLDISDSQYALLNRIDAFRAADSATHRENGSHG